ncbi:MAG: hypothetical protein IJZ42_12945 [Lachnospiraceae bacterium]|nr:hypothetical protein [Bacteroidales bacterium]MBQ8248027.1 hypothetical protein [Lachnospiraceae bacterium]
MVRNKQIDKIERILKTKYLAEDQNLIEEINLDSKGNSFVMKRTVVGHQSIEYKIYRFDPNDESLFPYFNPIEGLNKICDYIIFAENNAVLCVFLIELKKGKGAPEKQLNISEGFVKFILDRAKTVNCGIEKEIIIRKLGVKDTRLSPKRETGYFKNFTYDSNSYALLQSRSSLRLAFLIDAPMEE